MVLLREAAEFLLGDCEVDEAVYLGGDDCVKQVVDAWSAEIMGGPATEEAFLREAARVAAEGDADAITALLSRDLAVKRLRALRCLPPPPVRAVEVFDDKVMLFVHDKALLDEEDIANAFLVVYGRGKQLALNRFGPRTFFTPGPLRASRVALIERETDGSLAIAQYNPHTGEPTGREVLFTRGSQLVVHT